MKTLRDLIIESKLETHQDPFIGVATALSQCVTHYKGYGSAGRYTPSPSGKSGLDGSEINKLLNILQQISDVDCAAEKISQSDIANKIKTQPYIYISPYVYDKHQNNGKGYIGFAIRANKWILTLNNGYFNYRRAQSYDNNKLSAYNAFLIDAGLFTDLLDNVIWPQPENFTNVSDWDEFGKALHEIYGFLQQ